MRSNRTAVFALFIMAPLCAAAAPKAANQPKAVDQPKPRIKWEVVKLIESLNEGMDLADINRDGKVDIISGPCWFEAPKWTKHPVRDVGIVGEEFFDNNGDHAIDLNGDGYPDDIAASWFSDKIYWYENPGKEGLAEGRKWKQRLIVSGQGSCEGTLLQDIDGDGIPEFIINNWDAKMAMTVVQIKPGKNGAAPEFKKVEVGKPETGHGISVGDINGDKRPDIVLPGGWFEQPEGDWTAKPWKFHKYEGFNLEHTSVPGLIVDVNGDGRNDIIAGKAHDYGLFWMEQGPAKDGEPTWTKHEIDKSFSQVHCLVWADLDGDGKKEIVTGKRWRAHKGGDPGSKDPQCVMRFIWNPTSKSFEKDVISYGDSIGTGMQICVADLDGDKRPDLAVAGKGGTYILFNRGPAK
jgi:hypothetical protein